MNDPYAFPKVGGSHHVEQDGMTLRDYFAAKAMAAIMADPNTSTASNPEENDDIAEGIAKFSYVMADAMLAERDRK